MTILFTDGFDSYAATADLTKKWGTINTSAVSWNATGGRNGGGCLRLTNSSTGNNQNVMQTNSIADGSSSLYYGACFWFKVTPAPSGTSSAFSLLAGYDVNGNLGANLGFDVTTGALRALTNAGGIIATGTTAVCDNNWHWIEFYINSSSSANTARTKCYADGVLQWNIATGTSASADRIFDRFAFGTISTISSAWNATYTMSIDDLIIFNDQGSVKIRITDVPVGPQQITTVRPQADSTVSFGTLSSGSSHYALINETNPDGDTSYVQGSSGQADLYDFAAMGISPAAIQAVVANAYLENPNVGSCTFRQNAKSSSATTNGSTVTVPSAYQTKQQVFAQDPNTSSAWASASAVDGAFFGVEAL